MRPGYFWRSLRLAVAFRFEPFENGPLHQVEVSGVVRRLVLWAKSHQLSIELVAPVFVRVPLDSCVAKGSATTAFLEAAAGAPTAARGPDTAAAASLGMLPRLNSFGHQPIGRHVAVAPAQVCALVVPALPQRLEQVAGSVTTLACLVAQVRDHRKRGIPLFEWSAEDRPCAEGNDAPLVVLALGNTLRKLAVMTPCSNVLFLNTMTGPP